MAFNESEPCPKKLRLNSGEIKQANSLQNEDRGDREMCTNNMPCPPSSSSRDEQLNKPQAILHDKYCRSLETGE
jgi:hypothetical protein